MFKIILFNIIFVFSFFSYGQVNNGELGRVTDSVAYKNDTIPYYCIVNGIAKSKFGTNTLEAHFHVDSGFTKLLYRFEDSTSVDLILKEIKIN